MARSLILDISGRWEGAGSCGVQEGSLHSTVNVDVQMGDRDGQFKKRGQVPRESRKSYPALMFITTENILAVTRSHYDGRTKIHMFDLNALKSCDQDHSKVRGPSSWETRHAHIAWRLAKTRCTELYLKLK